MSMWQQWVSQPQTLWLRKAVFQIHLWSGIGVGLYVAMISVTGSVLVYRNELFAMVTRPPIVAKGSGPRLTDDQLKQAATRAYQGYEVTNVFRARNLDHAVDVWLRRGAALRKRLFDPYTGKDLGDSVPFGIWLMSKLLELHDDLLGGRTGRKVNSFGALSLIVLAATGTVVWWPGIRTWRRSLRVRGGVGWKRLTWELHSMLGFWCLAFILLFGITGLYLGNPEPFQTLADFVEPLTETNAGDRAVDRVMYWLAYLHFGRLGGRGIPGCGRGLCNSTTKVIWAVFGLVPAAMLITGAVMWWNRVVRRRRVTSRDLVLAAESRRE